jgi:hypothetical protein
MLPLESACRRRPGRCSLAFDPGRGHGGEQGSVTGVPHAGGNRNDERAGAAMTMTTPKTIALRIGATTLAGLAMASAALAAPQYSIWQMSCAQATSLINRQGAVVMYTAPTSYLGPATYERLVSGSNYCDPHETTTTIFAKSGDGQQCAFQRCIARDRPERNFR